MYKFTNKNYIPTSNTANLTTFLDSASSFQYFQAEAIIPRRAYRYYDTISSVGTAVRWIVDLAMPLALYLEHKVTGKVVTNHPFIQLYMVDGGANFRATHIRRELFISFLLTRTAYPVFMGNIAKVPAGMIYLKGYEALPNPTADGYLGMINTNAIYETRSFSRIFDPKTGKARFISADLQGEISQLCDEYSVQFLLGDSPLNSKSIQLEAIYSTLQHNLARINNAATPSGILMPEKTLDDDQYHAFQQEFVNNFTGLTNSGRPIIANSQISFMKIMDDLADMNFEEFLKYSDATVFQVYRIPQPFVNEKTTTMSNASNADSAIYEQAVFPFYDAYLSLLKEFADLRYPDLNEYYLKYDISQISALKYSKYQQAVALMQTNVATLDEIRAEAGKPPIGGEAGEVVVYSTKNAFITQTDLTEPPSANNAQGNTNTQGSGQSSNNEQPEEEADEPATKSS